MRICISWIYVWVMFIVAGCQTNPGNIESPVEVTLSPTITATSEPPNAIMTQPYRSPSTPGASGVESLIQIAKDDLAQRLSISVDQISLVEVTEAEWSDSSLDCPQPDALYLQVITPGYLILLESGGNLYEYHSNRDAYVIYCENRAPPFIPQP